MVRSRGGAFGGEKEKGEEGAKRELERQSRIKKKAKDVRMEKERRRKIEC